MQALKWTYGGFIFFIIAIQIIEKATYTHTHNNVDGTIIVHAHPYKKSPNPSQQHNHTHFELLVLDQLELLFPLVSSLITIIILPFVLLNFIYINENILSNAFYSLSGRSPPLFI